jgi:hypothetical protein
LPGNLKEHIARVNPQFDLIPVKDIF